MTRPRLPSNTALATSGRRGGVRGTGAASGSPTVVDVSQDAAAIRLGQPDDQPWLLDSREVARLLGIGRTKAFQLMARRELPVVSVGRCVRVPRNALASWIADRTRAVRPDLRPNDTNPAVND